MRKRWRYLQVHLESDSPIGREAFSEAVRSELLTLYGEIGMAEVDIRVLDFDESSAVGIVRCRREAVERLRTVVAAITEVEGKKVLPSVGRVSGTIKGLKSRRAKTYVESVRGLRRG